MDRSTKRKKIPSIFKNTLLAIIISAGAFVVFSTLPIKGNYRLLSVMSGSMEPTLPVGSLIVVRPSSTYQVGDIITFKNTSQVATDRTTTHRIFSTSDASGVTTFTTKGDANESDDSNQVLLRDIVGEERLAIPLVGYLLAYTKTLWGFVMIIVIPCLMILYQEFNNLITQIKKIHKARSAKTHIIRVAGDKRVEVDSGKFFDLRTGAR